MATRLQLRESLEFSQDLMEIIGVLKEVTAVSLHHWEKQSATFKAYADRLEDFFVWADILSTEKKFLATDTRLWLVITSDAGFLAGQNAHLVQYTLNRLEAARGDGLAVIGDRGRRMVTERGVTPVAIFPGVGSTIQKENAEAIAHFATREITEGRYGKATVVYPFYHSISRQEVTQLELFPPAALIRAAEKRPSGLSRDRILMESDLTEVWRYLVDHWMSVSLTYLFWHSKLSELAARTLHLEETHQELGHECGQLQMAYFRQVHEETDRNIREISATRYLIEKGGGLF